MPDLLKADWPDPDAAPPAATEEAIRRAAGLLARGGLVAIPTETVYGLAALALEPAAVRRIFEAKGRPARNPLIVHVPGIDAARGLASEWTPAAERLARRFWPGPLTIVVRKAAIVPDVVTAGGDTVAIRCPSHPVARRLLELLGRPIAAPSANLSLGVSPTTAAHVATSLGDRVDLILDAGPCERGIESTVVDCSAAPARLLRPGPVDRAAIEAALCETVAAGPPDDAVLRSPGLLGRHYAPEARLELASDGATRCRSLLADGLRVGWITRRPETDVAGGSSDRLVVVRLPDEPRGFARGLYAALHELDARGVEAIVVDAPPGGEPWRAVRDRLERAASAASS